MPSAFPAKMFPKSEQTELDNYRLQVEILQQKLAKSEQQRHQLEEKFEKIQKKRSEHEKSIKTRSRVKFEEFLEKQRERNERNKKIIRMLEHIDQQAALLAQRSSRLKTMKRQYELYFARLLQSQAIRLQQTPRYAFLPLNQYPPLTQTHDLTHILDSKDKIPELSPAVLISQDHGGMSNIPSINTVPATPPGNMTPRPQGSIQPLSSPMGIDNWNLLAPNNNYPISTIQNMTQHPRYAEPMGTEFSPIFKNNYGYNMQPNPLDFYRGPPMYNYPYTGKMPSNTREFYPQQNGPSEQWGYRLPSTHIDNSPRTNNSYSDTGAMPNKADTDNIMPLQRGGSSHRTFRDFDRDGHPGRNTDRRLMNEPNSARSEYDYSKATEEDLDLLRELNLRNRLRTFSNSNESLSQHDPNQEPYSYSRKDVPQDQYMNVEARNRNPPTSSHSRSSSVESRKLASNPRYPQSEDNYAPANNGVGSNEKSTPQPLTTTFSNIQQSNRDNTSRERQIMNMNPEESDKLQTLAINRTSPISDDRQRQTEIMRRPQHSEEAKPFSQPQQYSPQNAELKSPNITTIPTPEAVGIVNGTTISNNDKIILPSKNYKSSISAPIDNINNNSNEISAPSYYNDELNAADKRQRPALLKKIQIPNYLSPKSNAERNQLSNERTDADILKVHQPSGIDSSPLQFAKKEKLTLENIENAIYGELINPEMSMSSGSPNDAVAQVLRQHQTPAEILAQTNQGRKPTIESFNPQLTSFKDASLPYAENQIEKSDISEKILKNTMEAPNTKSLNMNLEKLKINEPVAKPQPNIPPTPPAEIPKVSKQPEFDVIAPKSPEIAQNNYDNYETIPQENKTEPVNKMQSLDVDRTQSEPQATFDYDNPISENTENYNIPTEPTLDKYAGQEQYQSEVDTAVNAQQSLDNNQTYPETQAFADSANPNDNVYQADQQQYDNDQNYQQYDEQNYTQDQQNAYENYPTDNNYQTEYDPNAYNYNYEQQQQADGTYADYPNQQYSEQDYNQQVYQDQNYTDQQYNQPEYSNDQDQSNLNQYDYSQQNIPTENYEQQQMVEDQSVVNQNEPIVEQQAEPKQAPASTTPTGNSGQGAQTKSVKPILTKEKSTDLDSKKKKRVNFIDSSDESSSKIQQQLQQQPATTDESDFDFSSQ